MKKHLTKSGIILLLACLLASCTKSNTTPDNDSNKNSNGSLPSYTFGTPQFVTFEQLVNTNPSEIREDYSLPQLSDIQSNAIATGVYFGSNGVNANINYFLSKNGQTFTSGDYRATFGVFQTTCYAIDSQGATLYAESSTDTLYKFNLNSTSTGWQNSKSGTVISNGLGKGNCIKIVSGGVTMTSDTLNGSLLQINDNGTKKIIARGLDNPVVFDTYNNDYYVVEYAQTGSVVKITQAGTVTAILNNLNSPLNICFDNNGNFVLETLQTFSSNNENAEVYTLYTSTGNKIGNLTDAGGASIQCDYLQPGLIFGSNPLFTPLFIDQYNNLYFSQRGSSGFPYGNGLIASGDNPTGTGIYKISITSSKN
jgi:hypothetical protein